jgi:Limiting CO2-inducible proteins B/C beta carbonyic anhydrases
VLQRGHMRQRERYAFFSYPHIALGIDGTPRVLPRLDRESASTACDALVAVLDNIQSNAADVQAYPRGSHDVDDPDFSILQQRLAARIALKGIDANALSHVGLTNLAEHAVTADLEALIASSADYAVMTGVLQVHNRAAAGTCLASLELIAPWSLCGVRGTQDGHRHFGVHHHILCAVASALACTCASQAHHDGTRAWQDVTLLLLQRCSCRVRYLFMRV